MPQLTGLPESVSFVKALRKRTVKELADGLRWRRENASYAIRKKLRTPNYTVDARGNAESDDGVPVIATRPGPVSAGDQWSALGSSAVSLVSVRRLSRVRHLLWTTQGKFLRRCDRRTGLRTRSMAVSRRP